MSNGRVGVYIPARWRREAACRGLDPMIFYPATEDEATRAKKVCSICPVRDDCLDEALDRAERDGVWGGATERERRRILRQARRAQVAPTSLV